MKASGESDAATKAQAFAEARQHSYSSQFGAVVHWKLDQVVDVKEIFDFQVKDGLELYHEYVGAEEISGRRAPRAG